MSFPGSILLDQGEIQQTSTTKKLPLGTRGYTRDGRVYRYAKNGAAALYPGMMVQAVAVDANSVALTIADSTDWAVPTTGATVFHISSDVTATANYFADGYFMVTAGSTADGKVGQMVQIQSHTAGGVAGPTGAVYVYPYVEDKLSYALTTTETVSLIANPYDKVIETLDAAPTGVAIGVCPTQVAASAYFWLQTWGMACMRVSDTWDTGHNIIYASATGTRAGEALPVTSLEADKGAAIVGVANYIGTDGYCGAAFITFAP